jgi:hypothetical protein
MLQTNQVLKEESFGAVTCLTDLNPASLLSRALLLPRVSQLWTSPPYRGELQCYHVSCSSRHRLIVEESSGAITCHATLDLTSSSRRAPVLSYVPRLQTSSPYRGGLRCCHASRGSRPCLSVEEGSGVIMRPAALNLDSSLRGGSGAATCPVVLCGPCDSNVKKVVVDPAVHLWHARSQGA